MSEILWRMPNDAEPPAQLLGPNVAEVAEGLEASGRFRPLPVGDLMMWVFSITAQRRPIKILLWRADDSWVWRVRAATWPAPDEIDQYLKEG